MGYYTRYSLEWVMQTGFNPVSNCSHNPPESAKFCPECGTSVGSKNLDDIVAEKIRSSEEMNYALCPDGRGCESTKWYDHEDHIKALSKDIPHVLFILSGQGEETGDIWRKYFLDGKMQVSKVVMTFDEFDPKKLK